MNSSFGGKKDKVKNFTPIPNHLRRERKWEKPRNRDYPISIRNPVKLRKESIVICKLEDLKGYMTQQCLQNGLRKSYKQWESLNYYRTAFQASQPHPLYFFICSTTHLFNKNILSFHSIWSTLLETENTMMNMTH